MERHETESSSDIRDCYDYEGDESRIAAGILDTRPPLWHGSKKTSGMDCLIVVLRRIYSFSMLDIGVSDDLGWVQESESKNPILGHAWHAFGSAPEDVDNATKARSEVENILKEVGLDPNASFFDLCCSSLMNETFWSKDVFRLAEPPFNRMTGEAIHISNDEVSKLSLVWCVDGQLSSCLGRSTCRDAPACFVPSRPWVIRMVLTCKDTQRNRTPFSRTRKFLLPVWEEMEESPTLAFQTVHETEYTLLAVVRLRDKVVKNDYVRTYSPYGPNIIPEYEPASFMSKGWSMESVGTYMLFYGIPPHDLGLTNTDNFPEVAEPEIVDETLVKDFKELMASLRNSEPSTQAQLEYSSSTTAGASSRAQVEGQHEKLTPIVEHSRETRPPPPPQSSPSPIPPPPPGSPPLENRPPLPPTREQIPRHKGNRGTGGSQERGDKRPSDARPTGLGHKKWRGSSRK